MKNFLLSLYFVLFAFSANASTISNFFINDDAADVVNTDTKLTWSYNALSEVLETMFKCYKSVNVDSITKIADYLIKNDSRASVKELAAVCVLGESKFSEPVVYNNSCSISSLKIPSSNIVKWSTSCSLFLYNLIEKQNEIIANGGVKKQPGTYVRKYSDGIYKIVEVIPAEGLYKNGVVDQNVNLDKKNTGIYDIDTGSRLKYNTWTNNMFINVYANNEVRGMYDNSYIFINKDITSYVFNQFNQSRGMESYSIGTFIEEMPDFGDMDIKYIMPKKFGLKVNGQTDSDAHTNGAVFNGKVANFEWVGHYLAGVAQQESAISNSVSDIAISWLQGGEEPDVYNAARYMGQEYHNNTIKGRTLSVFKNVQTKTEAEAYNMASNYVKKNYFPNENVKIVCGGECGSGFGKRLDDIVFCTVVGKDFYIDFWFDDICD